MDQSSNAPVKKDLMRAIFKKSNQRLKLLNFALPTLHVLVTFHIYQTTYFSS